MVTRCWFQMIFMSGEMIQFDYFSSGLKPPTSLGLQQLGIFGKHYWYWELPKKTVFYWESPVVFVQLNMEPENNYTPGKGRTSSKPSCSGSILILGECVGIFW